MKQNAAILVQLANALDAELAKAEGNVIPAGVGPKVMKIEKLAKEIKNWAKGS